MTHSHVSPSAALRNLLRLHGPRVRCIMVEHGVVISEHATGTGLRLLDAKDREISNIVGWTLVTPMIERILREHFAEVVIEATDDGTYAQCTVNGCRHGESHARD